MHSDLRAQLMALAGDYSFSRLEPRAPELLACALAQYDNPSCTEVIPSRPVRVLHRASRGGLASKHVC